MTADHGKRTEDVLSDICSRIFGADLVIRSPLVLEPSGAKEVADILVLVDDFLFVIQSKSLDIDISELDEVNFGRIKKRHDKAKKQLNTALNAKSRTAIVQGTTNLGIPFLLEWDRIKNLVGIITLNLPDKVYQDPEFRFQYPEAISSQRGVEIHTFVLRDLWEASVELTTPGDFILYLIARTKCLRSGNFVIGNELDLLALFKTDYPTLEKAKSDPAFRVLLAPGLWEGFRSNRRVELDQRQKRYESSYIIDTVIHKLCSAVDESCKMHGCDAQESAVNYFLLIGKLAKLARMERAKISDRILEKAKKTEDHKYGYFMYICTHFRIGYLFLLLNEEDRRSRINFLSFLAEQACHRIDADFLVAIGTDGRQQDNHSIDAFVADVADVKANSEPDPEYPMFGELTMGEINEWS